MNSLVIFEASLFVDSLIVDHWLLTYQMKWFTYVLCYNFSDTFWRIREENFAFWLLGQEKGILHAVLYLTARWRSDETLRNILPPNLYLIFTKKPPPQHHPKQQKSPNGRQSNFYTEEKAAWHVMCLVNGICYSSTRETALEQWITKVSRFI
jgi:hypothetical protein